MFIDDNVYIYSKPQQFAAIDIKRTIGLLLRNTLSRISNFLKTDVIYHLVPVAKMYKILQEKSLHLMF